MARWPFPDCLRQVHPGSFFQLATLYFGLKIRRGIQSCRHQSIEKRRRGSKDSRTKRKRRRSDEFSDWINKFRLQNQNVINIKINNFFKLINDIYLHFDAYIFKLWWCFKVNMQQLTFIPFPDCTFAVHLIVPALFVISYNYFIFVLPFDDLLSLLIFSLQSPYEYKKIMI